MAGAEVQHGDHILLSTRIAGGDVVHGEAEGEDVGGNGRAHTNKTNGTARAKERKELGEVHFFVCGDCDENEIERTRCGRHFFFVAVHQEARRAVREGVGALGCRGRNCGDLTAESLSKLDCHMT